VLPAQTEFKGLTGSVRFDDNGLRRGFKIDVLEVNINRGLAKVCHRNTGNHSAAAAAASLCAGRALAEPRVSGGYVPPVLKYGSRSLSKFAEKW